MCGTLQALVGALGEQQALRFMRHVGGTRMRIPIEPTPELLEVIPQDDAERLCALLGGEQINIPRGTALTLAERNRDIISAAAAGATRRQLALRYNTTERHIYRILASTDQD
jgi:hypothetical protein